MNRPKFYIYLPIVFSLVLILGIFIGNSFNYNSRGGIISLDRSYRYNKLGALLQFIQEEYVDTVDEKVITEQAISEVLKNLDPHSYYISAEELQTANAPLQGHFGGVGIEFSIINDTVCVVSVVAGAPAERAGVLAGDKIISADGKKLSGTTISTKDVMERLKGESGTEVSIEIKRRETKTPVQINIRRGEIPIYSIEFSNMLNDTTGYIKLTRFAATTYNEYKEAFNKLRKLGMKNLVLDLRNNAGGLLNIAVDLADEFLSGDQMIVYTEGKARPRKDYIATAKGDFESGELVVLIDEGSASASEILAGAIQDNDRGIIIGRRSFGKGLVQQQSEFSDGSALRLTIARYYTPTGRSIQKPYNNGLEEYYAEEANRFSNGELEHADSIKVADSLKYTTPKGKIVYGGGGIVPDVFVPIDLSGLTNYMKLITNDGLLNDFTFSYSDRERSKLKKFESAQKFQAGFEVSPLLFNEFIKYCTKNGIVKNKKEIIKSEQLIKHQLKALIARNIWGNEGFYLAMQTQDEVLKKALEYLSNSVSLKK